MKAEVHNHPSIAEEKEKLRGLVRRYSRMISLAEKFRLDGEILLRLMRQSEFTNARSIHLYLSSYRWEVSTFAIIEGILRRNGQVIIPMAIPDNYSLKHLRLAGNERLKRGAHRVWEPLFPALPQCDPGEADVILVPGIAFDRNKNRVGSGAGYYDRFLSSMKQPKISLAYGYQIFEFVPAAEFDQKVDILITENGVFD